MTDHHSLTGGEGSGVDSTDRDLTRIRRIVLTGDEHLQWHIRIAHRELEDGHDGIEQRLHVTFVKYPLRYWLSSHHAQTRI